MRPDPADLPSSNIKAGLRSAPMESADRNPKIRHPPPPEPDGPGRRVLAFLFWLVWLTPLFLCLEFQLSFPWLLLLLLPAAWFASGLRRREWLRWVTVTGLLLGGLFGRAMEGWEGAIWGALIGLVAGFAVAWYSLWLLRIIPDRWGSVLGWSLLGIAFALVPLLLAIRLLVGRFDDDDSPFILLAIGYGVFHAKGKGWWRDPFVPERVRPVLVSWLRFWTGPRALPWVVAFFVAGLVAGPAGSSFTPVAEGGNLSIVLQPISYVWPVCFVLAAAASWVASRKAPLNPFHRILCAVVLSGGLLVIVGCLRHHAEITPERLHLRHGLWGSVRLSREDLASIEIKTFRARRVSGSYAVLIDRFGKRYSLRRAPRRHEILGHLTASWGVPALPP